MECPICLNDWNSSTCIPLMLNCGHSFCTQCLTLMLANPSAKEIKCPNCEVLMALNEKGLQGLIKNYALISLVESQLIMKKKNPKVAQLNKKESPEPSDDGSERYNVKSEPSQPDNSSQPQIQQNQSDDESQESEESEVSSEGSESESSSNSNVDTDRDDSQILEKKPRKHRRIKEERISVEPPSVRMNQKCEKHENQLIHSYLKQRIKKSQIEDFEHTLVCTQCIYELNLNSSQIEIIPQVMKEIQLKIKSTRNLIQYRKNQLSQAQGYFHRIQQGNRQIIQSKMKEHFGKLRQIMDDYEQSCEENLGVLLGQQEEKIKMIQDGIDGEMDKLLNDEINLSSLSGHDNNEIIYMTNIIEDQHKHLAQEYQPNIQFKDISITLQLRESVYQKLGSLLKSNSKLLLDELRQEGEPIRFMDILQRDKHWKCQDCNSILSKELIFCENCQKFRPLEMFKNLVNNPQKVSSFELNCLEQRRKKEKQLILDQDLKEEDSSNGLDKMWFMISGDWLFQWKCFISNKISNSAQASVDLKNKVRLSPNKEIGILPPGPICNDDFFLSGEEEVLKENLELNRHYRGVNYQVWNLLQKIYGGGPLVVREELDIYSSNVIQAFLVNEKDKQIRIQQNRQMQEEEQKRVGGGRVPQGRYKNQDQQRDSQRALSQSSGVQIPVTQELFKKSGIAGPYRQGRRERQRENSNNGRGSVDRRVMLRSQVEDQPPEILKPMPVSRRNGSQKRNLFNKPNTVMSQHPISENKIQQLAPYGSGMIKHMSDKQHLQNEGQRMGQHEDVESDNDKEEGEYPMRNNKSGDKQGVSEFMNNIFNGFKHF